MTLIAYKDFKFKADTLKIIEQANAIITDYNRQGYVLTLRQLYYQFVAAALIENSQQSYKRLGSIITDGRLGGLISWDAIEDNHRTSAAASYVQEDEREVLSGIQYQLALDFWAGQEYYLEIWVEKDALLGVVSKAAEKWKVPHMACKGYLSASESWRAAQRFEEQLGNGKQCVLIHLGDHDPSGIDMTRDNGDRLDLFLRADIGDRPVDVQRIALNMDQVTLYNPPSNPAKVDDSRAKDYIKKFGKESWELDALKPSIIEKLIDDKIRDYIDESAWKATKDLQRDKRSILAAVHGHWDDLRERVIELMEE